jgi:cytochrome c-type biogenesis protein
MQYIIAFLEGIITFISPCLLPMLPIYVSYFAGGGERKNSKTLTGALGFVLGFTLVFVALGALTGTLGSFLARYQTAVQKISAGTPFTFGWLCRFIPRRHSRNRHRECCRQRKQEQRRA